MVKKPAMPETWFFRNQESFDFLGNFVVSEWIPANKKGLFRALSVPCSTGEEPYSVAMTLIKAGLPVSRFLITGVDISRKALKKARDGLYNAESFRSSSALRFQQNCFTKKAEKFQIEESIRNSVIFVHRTPL